MDRPLMGYLIVADSVRAHNDGTFSLIRGGLTRVTGHRPGPILFRGSILARVFLPGSEEGIERTIQVGLSGPGGDHPDLELAVPAEIRDCWTNAGVDFALSLEQPGLYTFVLKLDGQELDQYEFTAESEFLAGAAPSEGRS